LQTFADVQAFLLSEDELDIESDEEEVLAAREDKDKDPHIVEEGQHEEVAISYADLKASIEEYYDKNVAHIDQTDKLVETTMSTIDKRNDPSINKKIDEAIETFSKISTNTTKVLSLVKDFDFSTLESTVKDLQAHALKQEEASAT
ncbi:hypothetical protein Tco_1149160, partial [Tanacetum coccineum]